jgi:uncharacterized protein (DUF779 family)
MTNRWYATKGSSSSLNSINHSPLPHPLFFTSSPSSFSSSSFCVPVASIIRGCRGCRLSILLAIPVKIVGSRAGKTKSGTNCGAFQQAGRGTSFPLEKAFFNQNICLYFLSKFTAL